MTRKQSSSISLLKQGYEELRDKEKEQAEAKVAGESIQLQEGNMERNSPQMLLHMGFEQLERIKTILPGRQLSLSPGLLFYVQRDTCFFLDMLKNKSIIILKKIKGKTSIVKIFNFTLYSLKHQQ